MTETISKHTEHLCNHVRFQNPLIARTLVAKLSDAKAANGRVLIKNRVVLNQAHGIRFLNRYIHRNEHYRTHKAEVTAWLTSDSGPFQIPPRRDRLTSDLRLPFLIVLKNGFNFYHFVDDALRQFATVASLGPDYLGDIIVSSQAESVSDFIAGFIFAVFPQYRERVRFVTGKTSFDEVLTSFDTNLYAFTDDAIARLPAVSRVRPRKGIIKGFNPIANLVRTHRANVSTDAYESLRKTAIERCASVTVQDAKKLYIKRGCGARNRTTAQHDKFEKMLVDYGFTSVVLEEHGPLEQIKFVSSADLVVGFHGAGFAHLLFAKQNSTWLEVGTFQSLRERWLDFWHLSDIPAVRYRNYCLDFAKEDPFEYPVFAKESIVPPRITDRVVERLASDLEDILAGAKAKTPERQNARAALATYGEKVKAERPMGRKDAL